MLSVDERHINLQGCKNFGDLGGYNTRNGRRVRTGRLFRSAGLSELTEEDLTTLNDLGILAVCDLRRDSEQRRSPSRWAADSATRFHHIPVFPDTPGGRALERAAVENNVEASRNIMLGLYRRMIADEQSLAQIRRIFHLLADNETPLLVHCSGGKDRTGVACALILALLGVEQEVIMEDYMLSLELYTRLVDLSRHPVSQILDDESAANFDVSVLEPVYSVTPDYLHSALNAITELYGDMNNFIERGLGLNSQQQQSIREQLLE